MNATKKRDTQDKVITFRVDASLLALIDQLAEAVGVGVPASRRRSIAIRRAVLEAVERRIRGDR